MEKNVKYCSTHSPGYWGRPKKNVVIRGHFAEVKKALASRTFLKIHRYLEFDQAAVMEGSGVHEALKAFRLLVLLMKS